MTEEYGNDSNAMTLDEYVPTSIIPIDQSADIALLPSRMEWDKRRGMWVSDTFEDVTLSLRLIASTFVYALWSDKVGQPRCYGIGECCGANPEECNRGIRLFVEVEGLGYYYVDMFGIAVRSAQGIVKFAMANGPVLDFIDKKEVNTKFGKLYIPTWDKTGVRR
jgi:hypothetical protein